MTEFIEHVWLIGCSRCANEHTTPDELDPEKAWAHFERLGWSCEYPRVYCPQCNGERK